MSMIFFKQPAALDKEKHRSKRLKPATQGYSFAKSINAVPITVMEMAPASSEYPIVFALDADGKGAPIAVLGVREKENLFVDADGKWDAYYIPGFVRCYPFALQGTSDGKGVVVVLDEAYEGLDDKEGAQLFTEEGTPGPHLQQTISALEQFYRQEQASQGFVAMLKKHDLLVPRVLEVNTPNNLKIRLDGFHVVDEDRIAKLGDAALLELARNGGLGFIYAHLLSLGLMSRLLQRLEPHTLTEAA